ncbi:MAG: diacylglycerol/lipid kinase family protein [Actinomycetes bacterium]
MTESILMVANAKAGSAEARAIATARSTLLADRAVEFRETSDPHELDGVVNDLDDRTLVVAGGDGSLHAAVNALHRGGKLEMTVVGLIPLGTGNDLARSARIPLDPINAARVVLNGEPREHDLLISDEETIAINAVHLGIGAEAVRAGSRAKAMLGPAGYPVGAVLAGTRYTGWDLDVVVDGQKQFRDGRVLMVGISVGRTIGGGTPLAPGAEVDDGLADVTVASSTGPVRRARFAARLRAGQHPQLRDVVTTRGRVTTVTGDAVRANVDGEVSGPQEHWTWTLRPHAWRLIHSRGRQSLT